MFEVRNIFFYISISLLRLLLFFFFFCMERKGNSTLFEFLAALHRLKQNMGIKLFNFPFDIVWQAYFLASQ